MQGTFFRAILNIQNGKLPEAERYIALCRGMVDSELTALVGESYTRAYDVVCKVQQVRVVCVSSGLLCIVCSFLLTNAAQLVVRVRGDYSRQAAEARGRSDAAVMEPAFDGLPAQRGGVAENPVGALVDAVTARRPRNMAEGTLACVCCCVRACEADVRTISSHRYVARLGGCVCLHTLCRHSSASRQTPPCWIAFTHHLRKFSLASFSKCGPKATARRPWCA